MVNWDPEAKTTLSDEEVEYVEEKVEIIPGGIPITYNQKVESIIKFYKTDGRRSIQKWLNRMDKYKKIVLPILDFFPNIYYKIYCN